jgi:hypothetical protein
MRTTVVSGYREKLVAHLRNAADAIERGDDHYRLSTVAPTGAASDLVFEVDPALQEDRHTHLIVWEVDGLLRGRPAEWCAGESLRPT